MKMSVVTERIFTTERHTTSYLESGPADGPLMVFIHGWPELSIIWRQQLECFAGLGFRCIAPDMRGYGRSSAPEARSAYALEPIAADMVELLTGLGAERAIWIGHDWGSPVVWSLAAHHADRCVGVASLCVPYFSNGFAVPNLVPFVDRTIYPEAEYPWGQWDYQVYYQHHFEAATATFESDIRATFEALMRAGDPTGRRKPAPTAEISRNGGWFGGASRPPDVPRDPRVLSEEDLDAYVAAFERTGFRGADAWYVNQDANLRYADAAPDRGVLRMPVLFVHAAYDYVCETIDSRLAEPMRRDCLDLTEQTVATGHWMSQEQPTRLNAIIARWLAARLPESWPA
jgi:pimeloyl-ACP methyl ester carboxylesterase